MFSGLLSARFAEIAQKPDAPFLDAETNRGLFVRSAEATTLNALVADGGVEKGLAALFTEANRVARFGFTQTEFDRYRVSLLQIFAQLAASNDEHTSQSLADEFIRNFMQQEPIPGIAYEDGLVRRFLPEITLADVNSLAREWVPDRNRVVAVSAPKKAGVTVPDEATLAAPSSRGAGGGTLTAYVDTVSTAPLIETLPKPGAVTNTVAKTAGDHRVDAVERRAGGARADDVQAGRDPVPGLQSRRHIARWPIGTTSPPRRRTRWWPREGSGS